MKRFVIAFTTLIVSVSTVCAQESSEYYLTAEELPNGVKWMPAPPDTISTEFVYDITQYMWGKSQRGGEREQEAINHSVDDISEMAYYFSEPFGMTISEIQTPHIFNLLNRGIRTMRLSATLPKETYMRKRPYVRFNEPTSIPEEEESKRNSGSYPSGHTIRGWGMALILCEINPERQDDILKLGFEWGQSRVIVGYHWQSDVDASRMLAAASFARLHACPEYIADLIAAQEEFATLTGNTTAIRSYQNNSSVRAQDIYDIQGRRVSEPSANTHNVYIQGSQKILAK